MARIVIGVCPQCGAVLKVQQRAVHANMPYTCRCRWAGTVHVNEDLVARAEKLRAERLGAWNLRNSKRQSRMWTWSAGLLAVASVVCLVLALIVPRVWPDWENHQRMTVLLFALSGAGALGFLFCLSALHDVGKATARRKRRNRRRRP